MGKNTIKLTKENKNKLNKKCYISISLVRVRLLASVGTNNSIPNRKEFSVYSNKFNLQKQIIKVKSRTKSVESLRVRTEKKYLSC